MNTLSINSPQPSFKGVIIYPNITEAKRPLTSFVLHVVPDSDIKGIQTGSKVLDSDAADYMTKLFANQNFTNKLWLNPYTHWFKKLINKVIHQSGLEYADKDDLFKFINNKRMSVKSTPREGEYKLRGLTRT